MENILQHYFKNNALKEHMMFLVKYATDGFDEEDINHNFFKDVEFDATIYGTLDDAFYIVYDYLRDNYNGRTNAIHIFNTICADYLKTSAN